MAQIKLCPTCSLAFEVKANQTFCSVKCRNKRYPRSNIKTYFPKKDRLRHASDKWMSRYLTNEGIKKAREAQTRYIEQMPVEELLEKVGYYDEKTDKESLDT